MAYISRNPFAREELHRSSVPVTHETCAWCGSQRRGGRDGSKRYLYQYRTESDGGRKFEHSGLFCSKSCHDSYH